VVIVLLVLVHFGGILTAVTSIPPPTSPPPWIPNQLWVHFYRNYLQFMYLNNAYHFYSPEPGPPTLVWFNIDYSDGSSRWVRIPERDQFRTRMEYQRRLALTESINQLAPTPPGLPDEFARRRALAGAHFGIPLYPNMPLQRQFQEPQPYSKVMLSCYARYAARTFPSEENHNATIEGIKIYRVVHNMLSGPEMAAGRMDGPPYFKAGPDGSLSLRGLRPDDPSTYTAYFQGEYDRTGKLKNDKDPFLYWLIPIVYEPKPGGIPNPFRPEEAGDKPDFENAELKDYHKVHAAIRAKAIAEFMAQAPQ
jgi:hypothetical protein